MIITKKCSIYKNKSTFFYCSSRCLALLLRTQGTWGGNCLPSSSVHVTCFVLWNWYKMYIWVDMCVLWVDFPSFSSLATERFWKQSVSMDLPILHFSYKCHNTICNLLCLASSLQPCVFKVQPCWRTLFASTFCIFINDPSSWNAY